MSRKYILPIVFALSLLILLVPACGSSDDNGTPVPTSSPTATATPTVTPTSSPTPTAMPTATPTPVPTSTPTPTASPTASTPTPTIIPSSTEPPCRFHGTVQVNGAAVPDYTTITVTISGYTYSTVTPSIYGDSTYVIKISPPQDIVFAPGTPLTFKIGDKIVQQTGSWQKGGNVVLNLTAP